MEKMFKKENWAIIILEILFGLCASSVILYRILGWAFDFGAFSYRVFNIVISLIVIVYIFYALIKEKKYVYHIITFFSLFHFIEGIIISFWFKVVIHFLILLVMVKIYWRRKNG